MDYLAWTSLSLRSLRRELPHGGALFGFERDAYERFILCCMFPLQLQLHWESCSASFGKELLLLRCGSVER